MSRHIAATRVSTHGQPLSAAGADIDATIRNLGGNPAKPFAIFPEVQKIYAHHKEELRTWFLARQKKEEKFCKGHSELSAKLDLFLSGKLPKINYSSIKMKEHIATRAASSTMLRLYAQQIGNIVVASTNRAEIGRASCRERV